MRKRHARMRNGAVTLTLLTVVGLFFYGQKIERLKKELDYKISVEKVAVEEKKEQLAKAQAELESMDSLEYVRKIADEELKMVEKDTIVFRAKE